MFKRLNKVEREIVGMVLIGLLWVSVASTVKLKEPNQSILDANEKRWTQISIQREDSENSYLTSKAAAEKGHDERLERMVSSSLIFQDRLKAPREDRIDLSQQTKLDQ